MKAGAFTPAIPVVLVLFMVPLLHRSMKAGAFTPAIPPDHDGQLRLAGLRSMKAGAFTPAIQFIVTDIDVPSSALNEGGGFHPRNPIVNAGVATLDLSAQ